MTWQTVTYAKAAALHEAGTHEVEMSVRKRGGWIVPDAFIADPKWSYRAREKVKTITVTIPVPVSHWKLSINSCTYCLHFSTYEDVEKAKAAIEQACADSK